MDFADVINNFSEGEPTDGTDFSYDPDDFTFGDLLSEIDEAGERRVDRLARRGPGISKKLATQRGLNLRLLPGAYDIPKKGGGTKKSISVPYGQHWINSIRRYTDCLDDKCVVCYYLKRRAIRDVTTSLRQMITVFSLDTWHIEDVPYTDAYGQSGIRKEKHVCTGPGCQNCSDGLPTKAGWWTLWPMALGHYKNLLGHLTQIAMSCSVCQERVYPLILMCGVGDCGFGIDTFKDRLKDSDVQHYIKNPTVCPTCGNRRKMKEQLGCFDDNNKLTGCTGSARTDPFSVNIRFRVEKDAKATFSTLHMLKYSKPTKIDFANDYPDWPEDKVRPMNLLRYQYTTTPDIQSELLKLKNPFANLQEV